MIKTSEKIQIRAESVLFARYLENLLMDAGYKCSNIILNFGEDVDFISVTDSGLPMPALLICSTEIVRKTFKDYNAFKAYPSPVLVVGYQDEFVRIAQDINNNNNNNSKKRENVRFLYRPFLDEKFLESVSELLALNDKIKAAQDAGNGDKDGNREKTETTESIKREKLVLNKVKRTVSLGEKQVRLTEREFELLELLVKRRGENVSNEEITRTVWKNKAADGSNVSAVYINYLRNKLHLLSDRTFIFSVRGIGYRMRTEI